MCIRDSLDSNVHGLIYEVDRGICDPKQRSGDDCQTSRRATLRTVRCPLSILSDQGKEVDGRIMREVCRLFDIEKLRTTPYKPSTNQVERFHRTMNSVLAKTVSEHQRDWDLHLSFALAAFRATRHDSTGYSPNYLVFGREVRTPVDICLLYTSPSPRD